MISLLMARVLGDVMCSFLYRSRPTICWQRQSCRRRPLSRCPNSSTLKQNNRKRRRKMWGIWNKGTEYCWTFSSKVAVQLYDGSGSMNISSPMHIWTNNLSRHTPSPSSMFVSTDALYCGFINSQWSHLGATFLNSLSRPNDVIRNTR